MTGLYSAELQNAVFSNLNADGDLQALIGTDIYDAMPSGTLPETFVLVGEEAVFDRSDKTNHAALYVITVTVVTTLSGFGNAKTVAAAVCNSLEENPVTLAAGNLRRLDFRTARATRDSNGTERRIALSFRALIDDI